MLKKSMEILSPPLPSFSEYVKYTWERTGYIILNFIIILFSPFLAIYQSFWPKSIDRTVKPYAREYFWTPGKKYGKEPKSGILFIHGFSSNPEVFREYAQKFLEKGYVVLGARIEGHGTSPAHLASTSCVDWYLSVRNKYLELQSKVDDVIIVAHSLGSLLALILASIYPIKSMVILSSPIKIRSTPLFRANFLLRPVSKIVKYWPSKQKNLPILQEKQFNVYPLHPLNAVAGLFDTNQIALSRLDKVKCPILIMLGDDDEFIELSTLDLFKEKLKGKIVETWIAPNATHAIIDTTALNILEEKIEEFVLKNSPPKY